MKWPLLYSYEENKSVYRWWLPLPPRNITAQDCANSGTSGYTINNSKRTPQTWVISTWNEAETRRKFLWVSVFTEIVLRCVKHISFLIPHLSHAGNTSVKWHNQVLLLLSLKKDHLINFWVQTIGYVWLLLRIEKFLWDLSHMTSVV